MNKQEVLRKATELLDVYEEGKWNFEIYWGTHNEAIEIRMNKIGL